MFGANLLKLRSSQDCKSPPKANLRPQLEKQCYIHTISIHQLGLDINCYV
jgi:hypothetical protein